MTRLTPEELEQVVGRLFPIGATSWAQATDEVRDMCRQARLLAEVSEDEAVDFRALKTPALWNSQGIAGIVKFYKMLRAEQQVEFCSYFATFLAGRGCVMEEQK